MSAPPDPAAKLAALVASSLDGDLTTAALAGRAYQSRTQFHRLFRAVIEETPQAMRRRLQLERAAWALGRTRTPVTDIALDAGYGSLEAFTRAFRKAYNVSPSLYRRIGSPRTELPSPNGIHFRSLSTNKGANDMNLYEYFAGNESWHTGRLLEYASNLTDDQLDRPLGNLTEAVPFQEQSTTLRQVLENIIYTKEIWAAALLGKNDVSLTFTPPSERTPARLMDRLRLADTRIQEAFQTVSATNTWEDEFVDALCEPPETFTYASVFTHIITFNAHRRLQALDALRQLGVTTEGFGDPTEFERAAIVPR
jgi:AraC family transcriptional regulator